MKHLIFILLCFGIFAETGCRYSNNYDKVNVNNEFTISVPSWMSEQHDLDEGAPFQYANRFRNFYAIGSAEADSLQKQDLSKIVSHHLQIIESALKNPVITDSTDVTIGGLKGVRVEIYGKMNEENIYFNELVLKGKNKFYHVSVWTRGEDRKLLYKEDANNILASFREL